MGGTHENDKIETDQGKKPAGTGDNWDSDHGHVWGDEEDHHDDVNDNGDVDEYDWDDEFAYNEDWEGDDDEYDWQGDDDEYADNAEDGGQKATTSKQATAS